MIGLDTNVLVRYLVRDDQAQAERAARAIETGDMLFVSSIVLCQLVWVLASVYSIPKDVIADILDKLLATAQFEIEDRGVATAALGDFRDSKADYADCLIGRRHLAAGCAETVTFDRSLKGLDGFRLLA